MASIRKRPDGVYRARYRDEAGKEHARHFARRADAQTWLNEVTASIVTGQYVDPKAGKVKWSAWCSAWLARQAWADGTRVAARMAVESVPWKDDPIGTVRPSHVQAWVAKETKRGLAPTTVRTRLNFVQMAFRAAVLDKVVPVNPAIGVKGPRVRRAEASMHLLTAEQVAAALDAAEPWFRPFVSVCVFAGLRLGEAAGLQLGDVDFLRRTIRVERQVQGQTIATTSVVPPKAGSERTVYVPEALTTTLSVHVAARKLTAADEHLFRAPNGQLLNRLSAGAAWRKVREAAGLGDDLTLHSLRHTFASNLIAQGCDVVTVQRALGHAQPSITLNVYSHLWPSAEDRTRAATADFMKTVAASAKPADSGRTQEAAAQVSGLSQR
jgi:integrase